MFLVINFIDHGEDNLYKELWKACAGPLVDIPQNEEQVFYFPQGHMEQVSVYFVSSNSDCC